MGGLLFVFLVVNALIWPTHQASPDGCSILRDPHSRVKCGDTGIDEATCNGQGCCFDSSTANAVSCFLPAYCPAENRNACELGFKGITQGQCECRGCCFDAAATETGIPCFQPGPTATPSPTTATPSPTTATSCDYTTYDNNVIAMNNFGDFKQKMTIDECKSTCDKAAPKCKGFEYRKTDNRCFLSKLNYEEGKEKHLIRKLTAYTLYSCPSPATKPPASNCDYKSHDNTYIVKHNFGDFKQKMTVEECTHVCNTAGSKCQGFEYRKKDSRCFLCSMNYDEAKEKELIRTSTDYTLYSCSNPATKPPEPACVGKKMDLMFALDESSSINKQGFKDIKNFAKGIVEKLPIGADQMQVGVMTFSSSSLTRFTLRTHRTQFRVLKAIAELKARGGNTYTHTALASLVDLMLPINGGRPDAIKVAIIETDGASKNKTATKAAAAAARAAGITLIAVGVGDFDKKEIHDIASEPASIHAFTVKEFSELSTIIAKITQAACAGTPPIPVTTAGSTINPAKVPKMCKDIPESERKGVNFMIDPDGPFHGADPFIAECDFKGIGGIPVTLLHNKQEKKTCQSGCEERDHGCFVQTIQYHGSGYQARTMVDNAIKCFQYMSFDCFRSALDYRTHDKNGPFTWWTDRTGKKMNYWPGGSSSGGCSCGKNKSCARKNEKCNCDSRDRVWRNDHGTITDKKALPVLEVAIGDVSRKGSQGCFTMGPLKCL